MTEFIWSWTKGEKKVFTKNVEIAEKAMKEGMLIIGKIIKPTIL